MAPAGGSVLARHQIVCAVVNFDNVIRPRFNQLVAFNGSLPHMVRQVESGVRYSIALNLWAVTPMTYSD